MSEFMWEGHGQTNSGSRTDLSQISGLPLFLITLCEGTCSNTNRMVILAHLKRFPKLCVINYL